MNIERFDVVDEKDNPTGQTTTKEQAHKDGIIHRVAAILIFRANGKILVQQHKQHGRRLDHAVGGHVSTGEDYITAAKREMQEELGLNLAIDYVATVLPGNDHFETYDQEIRHNYGVFKAMVPDSWKFEPNEEVDQLTEMTVEDTVTQMNSNPDKFLNGFLTTLAAYLRVENSPLEITAYGKNWGEL